MSFSYDLTTAVGQTRLLISDSKAQEYTFEDEELTFFLSAQSQNTYLAAAMAYGVIIRDRALLSKQISREGYSSSEYAITELKSLIQGLKDDAITAGGLQSTELLLSDENFEAYRQTWRNFRCPPTVLE